MKSGKSENPLSKKDRFYIRQCFRLAQKGAGKVSPNPLVGCIIVKNDRVIAKGWHEHFGGPHAEAMAFSKIAEDVRNATLYCSLEPCCHTNKKTPPCLPLVINSGIKRVVLSNRDPNPQVAGKSIQRMRDAGIEVVENVLSAEGSELNRFFFKHISSKRPWVTIKIAQSMDGKIAFDKNTRTQITGSIANKFVHRLRASNDAVLIGANTIAVDNPLLNVRYIKGRNPLRIIIAGNSKPDPNAHVFKNIDKKTWIFYPEKIQPEYKQVFINSRARLIETATDKSGILDLNFVIDYLGKENINSVLIEGGQRIFSQFIEQKLFDEIIVLQSGQFFGKGVPVVEFSKKIDLEIHDFKVLGSDCYINLRKKA